MKVFGLISMTGNNPWQQQQQNIKAKLQGHDWHQKGQNQGYLRFQRNFTKRILDLSSHGLMALSGIELIIKERLVVLGFGQSRSV